MIHHKKIYSHHFEDIIECRKRFEIRKGFVPSVGDNIILHEICTDTRDETGRYVSVFVTRVFERYYGLMEGYTMIYFELGVIQLEDGTIRRVFTKGKKVTE